MKKYSTIYDLRMNVAEGEEEFVRKHMIHSLEREGFSVNGHEVRRDNNLVGCISEHWTFMEILHGKDYNGMLGAFAESYNGPTKEEIAASKHFAEISSVS